MIMITSRTKQDKPVQRMGEGATSMFQLKIASEGRTHKGNHHQPGGHHGVDRANLTFLRRTPIHLTNSHQPCLLPLHLYDRWISFLGQNMFPNLPCLALFNRVKNQFLEPPSLFVMFRPNNAARANEP